MTTALDRAKEKAAEAVGGEMTLLEHLLELRTRVMWSAITVVVAMVVFFVPSVGFGVIGWMLAPARETIPDFRPQYIEPMENIAVYFRVALLGGVTVAMPMLVFQLLGFVAPALTKSEKRWLFPIVVMATVAFIGGLAFGYWIVLPVTLGFLLSFGNDVAQADWRIGNYIGFVTRILLVMGFVFETPLLVMGLAKAGVVTARKLLKWWRLAIVAAFLVAAVVTPTIDPITQSLVGGPIVILYFVGIGLAWLVRRE
ncbi:MAG: twin-arginine translocase subunit TatC [Chloroflexi bacterium]|nr:twin-arginine translocase subunit TatC [Chloroflexota bacterium]